MNRDALLIAVSSKLGVTKSEADRFTKGVFEAVSEALSRGESVTLVGFGTWSVAERPAREGRNPQTGEALMIKAAKVVKFKAGKLLKDKVNY